jgi:hypothetical protein
VVSDYDWKQLPSDFKSVRILHYKCGQARPSSEVRVGLCLGALDGLAFFGSFWGDAKKKEQLII